MSSSSTKDLNYSEFYTFEIAFSVSIVVLILNLVQIMRIKYGQQLITHLSLRPYYVSLAILLVMITEFVLFSYMGNIQFENDFGSFLGEITDAKSVSGQFITPMILLKVALVVIFITVRAHELELLLILCVFQKKLRVQDLEVHRDSFIRLENQLYISFKIGAWILLLP